MARPYSELCTLTEARRRLRIPNDAGAATPADWLAADAQADPNLRVAIRAASQLIETVTGHAFMPYMATRVFDAMGRNIRTYTLDLDEELLEISAFVNGDGNTITGSDYVLLPGNEYPKWRINLLSSANIIFTNDGDWQQAISITGLWGFHDAWPYAFTNTLDSIQTLGGISASAVSFTVADSDGADELGGLRFEVGMLLKAESEYLLVTDNNPATNTLTIARGYRGTTAAIHAKDTVLYSYQVPPDVMNACAQLAVYFYQRRETSSGTVQFLDTNVMLRDTTVQMILSSVDYRMNLLPGTASL